MHPDPYESARRVAAQIEAILAIHGDNLLAMRRACEVIHRQRQLMQTAWQQAARASGRADT